MATAGTDNPRFFNCLEYLIKVHASSDIVNPLEIPTTLEVTLPEIPVLQISLFITEIDGLIAEGGALSTVFEETVLTVLVSLLASVTTATVVNKNKIVNSSFIYHRYTHHCMDNSFWKFVLYSFNCSLPTINSIMEYVVKLIHYRWIFFCSISLILVGIISCL